ncbi:MAG: PPC domain-containing protein [Anaerolineae bacterium]|jgi:hypothetical protein|nr:PPC domain-containing protein [Anaerolineae bacterium]
MLRFRLGKLIFLCSLLFLVVSALYAQQATPTPIRLVVAPSEGEAGTLHLIYGENLTPNTTYTLIITGPNETNVLDTPVTSSSSGTFSVNFNSEDLPPGVYNAEIVVEDRSIASALFTITAPPATSTPIPPPTLRPTNTPSPTVTASATIAPTTTPTVEIRQLSVDPAVVIEGVSYVVSIDGLRPNASHTFEIVVNGEVIFESVDFTSDTGRFEISLVNERTDPIGIYELNLYYTPNRVLVATGTLQMVAQAETTVPDEIATINELIEGDLSIGESGDPYEVTAEAGQTVVVVMESADFDAYLLLEDDNGDVIMRNDNGAGGENAQIIYTVPETGTYTVIATSRRNQETGGDRSVEGAYTLSIQVARVATSGVINSGETVEGRLDADQQTAEYTFVGQVGDVVTIDLASDQFDPAVGLLDPDGRLIRSDDDGGPGLYARLIAVELDEDGEYTIVVDGYRGFTGDRTLEGIYWVSLRITREETTDPDATPTQVPPVVEGDVITVTYGETVTGELTDETQEQVYTFEGDEGDIITISMDSNEFDTLVILQDQDGVELTRDDDSGPGTNALIEGFTLPSSGQYQLIATGYRGVSGDEVIGGLYQLTLEEGSDVVTPPTEAPTPQATEPNATETPPLAAGEIAYGATVSGEFDEQTQLAEYQFMGSAGDVITIDLMSDDFDPFVSLLNGNGDLIAADDDSGGNLQARITEFTLTETATYTIVVDAFRGFAGNQQVLGEYSLTLTLLEAGEIDPQDNQPLPQSTPELTMPDDVPSSTDALPRLEINPREAEAQALAYGDTGEFLFEGRSGEAAVFSFNAETGDMVDIYAYSDRLDTVMRLFAPDGTQIANDDDSNVGLNPELRGIILPQDGEYRIIVQSWALEAGEVEIVLLQISPEVLTDIPQQIVVTPKGTTAPIKIEGREGESLRLFLRPQGQLSGEVSITVTQNGVILVQSTFSAGSQIALDFTPNADGPISVTVSYGGGSGSAILDVFVEPSE